jgi:hypothetical protein
MAVNEVVRFPGSGDARCVGDENGMAGRVVEPGVEADGPAVMLEPGGAGLEIVAMLRLGGHAGETDVFAEFFDETIPVEIEVVKDGLHERRH